MSLNESPVNILRAIECLSFPVQSILLQVLLLLAPHYGLEESSIVKKMFKILIKTKLFETMLV